MKGKVSRDRKSAGRSKTTASKVRPRDVPNQAAASGFLRTVLDYLERGGDVNAQGLLDETLLYSAVGGGKWKVVDALLKAGADVTVPNYVGETPLHRAADLGLADFVEALLEHGADPNTSPPSEIRPLHAAAWSNRTGKAGEEPKGVPKSQKRRVIQLLLKAGADPNAREGAGRTALDLYDESANKDGLTELKAAMKR